MTIAQQGWGQMPPAIQSMIRGTMRSASRGSSPRRSRSAGSKRTKKVRRASSSSTRRKGGKLKRLVKGSAAAKAYMAKIRKLRK